ncbi:MAG: hypothetical protein FD143_3434 [Ignavibacteria bacterium]|nr:MAG: hypothetical protein FD143_3434 [Ignavibacteria bacterium]
MSFLAESCFRASFTLQFVTKALFESANVTDRNVYLGRRQRYWHINEMKDKDNIYKFGSWPIGTDNATTQRNRIFPANLNGEYKPWIDMHGRPPMPSKEKIWGEGKMEGKSIKVITAGLHTNPLENSVCYLDF